MVQRLKQAAKKAAATGQDAMTAIANDSPVGVRAAMPPIASAKRAPAAPKKARTVQQERDDLKAALAAAEARIHKLEENQTQVVNRIGWMLEALQTLKDESK